MPHRSGRPRGGNTPDHASEDAYSVPCTQAPYYEFDHLIPLAISGANTIAHLWPQPWAEANEKDVLEVELQRRVCRGLLSQAQSQREVADVWTAAYRRYVGRVPVAAAGYDEEAMSVVAGLKARIAATAWRWARRRLLGAE